jgi:predicted CopG family antitoxin
MAVKTITIDMEAYDALSRHKRESQSFSQVIKEHFGKRGTGRDLAAAIANNRLSKETIDAIDEVVKSREKAPPPREVRWW